MTRKEFKEAIHNLSLRRAEQRTPEQRKALQDELLATNPMYDTQTEINRRYRPEGRAMGSNYRTDLTGDNPYRQEEMDTGYLDKTPWLKSKNEKVFTSRGFRPEDFVQGTEDLQKKWTMEDILKSDLMEDSEKVRFLNAVLYGKSAQQSAQEMLYFSPEELEKVSAAFQDFFEKGGTIEQFEDHINKTPEVETIEQAVSTIKDLQGRLFSDREMLQSPMHPEVVQNIPDQLPARELEAGKATPASPDAIRPEPQTGLKQPTMRKNRSTVLDDIYGYVSPEEIISTKYGLTQNDLTKKPERFGLHPEDTVGDDELLELETERRDKVTADARKQSAAKALAGLKDLPEYDDYLNMDHNEQLGFLEDLIESSIPMGDLPDEKGEETLKDKINRLQGAVQAVSKTDVQPGDSHALKIGDVTYEPTDENYEFWTVKGGDEARPAYLEGSVIAKALSKELNKLNNKRMGRESKTITAVKPDELGDLGLEERVNDARKSPETIYKELNEDYDKILAENKKHEDLPARQPQVIPLNDDQFLADKRERKPLIPQKALEAYTDRKTSERIADVKPKALTEAEKKAKKEAKEAKMSAENLAKLRETEAYKKKMAEWRAAGKPKAEKFWTRDPEVARSKGIELRP